MFCFYPSESEIKLFIIPARQDDYDTVYQYRVISIYLNTENYSWKKLVGFKINSDVKSK